ncbi:MAG: IMP dehydrogenase [Deltaproteobacteria bacterium]|nr:IMP dehydrogenase [Deltaproteobacteria bacterium]
MAIILPDESRTFSEYLLLPSLTTVNHIPQNVDLSTPLVRYKQGQDVGLKLNIPIVSALMQSVSDDKMAIALARNGGLSFIYCSQPIEREAEMIRRVKKYKAGFVTSDVNLPPTATLGDAVKLSNHTGHSTIPITDQGRANGKLHGILFVHDIRIDHLDMNTPVVDLMVPNAKLMLTKDGVSLKEANAAIWEHRIKCLPIIDNDSNLVSLVFRKDFDSHKKNPYELIDEKKRLRVGAGINTRDYKERVPELVKAGADVLCIDSSDGFSEWQKNALVWIKKEYGDKVKVGAGNVVDGDGFDYLVSAGADFVKVGIGGGSICITREQKGIGRGQASAVLDVAKARDAHAQKTGNYIPICSDGGISQDYHIVVALALGADFVMMGRYFARFDESPTRKLRRGVTYVKEYWGEGSNRARNWERYDVIGEDKAVFEEGVDCYVPYAGKLSDNLDLAIAKIKATFCNCGALNIKQMHQNTRLAVVSPLTLREGGSHDVYLKETESEIIK